ncbi:MAG TPA: NrtA/SsuA/CpmA family ABC transporter substrate-binding protein [Pseudolabrys sp.]|nr:NrtA/SsuA/CpmA family ABC transporter substrate-binding protein [Pseudolabrys sp.]
MTKLVLRRRDFLSLTGATLAAAAGGLRAQAAGAPLNFGYQNTSWGAIGMIAQSQDMFKKAGADVAVHTFDSGKTTRDAMISGRIDIGVIGSTPFVVGAAKGELEAIGLALYGSKTLAVVVGLKSGINSLKDLKGKRVGSQLGSATDAVFQNKILPSVGLSKNDVQIVNVRFQNHISALASGSIDAFAGVEPFPSVAEVDKLGKVLTDYSPYDLQPIILAANKPVVDKNKDAVIAFMRGWLAAVKVYQDNRDEATAIVLKHFKDQGFSVTDKVIKLMLSKIDVTPDFGPQLKSYLTDEAKTLLAQNKIATMPNWDQRLNAGILAAARGKA